MNKINHWIFGIFLSIIFILFTGYLNLDWFYFTFSSILIILGIILFYSILPDIDHKTGTMTWVFLGISILGIILGILGNFLDLENAFVILVLSALLLIFTFYSAHVLPHRGIIHTMQIGILSVIPLWFLFGNIGYCFLAYVSWYSHLLADGYLFKIR